LGGFLHFQESRNVSVKRIVSKADRHGVNPNARIAAKHALRSLAFRLAAALKTMVGPSKQRGVMLTGTVGGITLGVLSSPALSNALGIEVSAITSLIAIVIGWAVAWQFVWRIPRTAA
jgi:hypothetical protein